MAYTLHPRSSSMSPVRTPISGPLIATCFVSTQPSSTAVSGQQFLVQPVVRLVNPFGVPVQQFGVIVTATSTTGVNTLNGTTSVVTDANGVAVFTDLSFTGSLIDSITFTPLGGVGTSSNNITMQGSSAPPDSLYFASNEVPFADSVLTDDFRRGYWYLKNADANSALGKTWLVGGVSGFDWGGTIFNTPATPSPSIPGAVVNLQALGLQPSFGASPYAGCTGQVGPGFSQQNNAWHNFFGYSGSPVGGYSEIYVRGYKFFCPINYLGAGNPTADYSFGGQKSWTVNGFEDDAGIRWAGVGYNVGAGSSSPNGQLMATNNSGTNIILGQNQGNTLIEVKGNWYYEEFRIKFNTPGNSDGIFQLWINNGGPTGVFTGSPTLRASYSNVDWTSNASQLTHKMGVIWLENWSNATVAPSVGVQLWKNIHVRTAAMCGFAT